MKATIQIAINLADPVYSGKYHSRQSHPSDLPAVIARSQSAGCTNLMVTGSSLQSSREAIELSLRYPRVCHATVGIHPCSTLDFTTHPGGAPGLLSDLSTLIKRHQYPSGPVTAIGEIGLDYDRLSLSPAATQREFFEAQLDMAIALGKLTDDVNAPCPLPLFLHMRAAAEDFTRILRPRLDRFPKRGVVHSFTGSVAEMHALVEMGFAIGINGCSVRTDEGLAVVKELPLTALMVETDGPWCEIRPSHASARFLADKDEEEWQKELEEQWKAVKKEKFQMGRMVKGRNEPCLIGKVVRVVAGVKGIAREVAAQRAWENSVKMFGLGVDSNSE